MERLQYHRDTNIRLSKLAILMVEAFAPGHDRQQTPEYEALQAQYRDIQVEKQEHDKFTNPEKKSRFTVG